MPGRSRTRPACISWKPRSISASDGATVMVVPVGAPIAFITGGALSDRRRPSTRSRPRRRCGASARRSTAPPAAGRGATRGTCGAGRRPTRRPARRLGAVVERHAAHGVALAPDRVTWRPTTQLAAGGQVGGEHGLRHRPAAADRPADPGDVAHRVGERAEPGARQLGADAPHHRPDHGGRPGQRRRG